MTVASSRLLFRDASVSPIHVSSMRSHPALSAPHLSFLVWLELLRRE